MKYYTSQLQEDVKNIFKLNMQKKKTKPKIRKFSLSPKIRRLGV